MIGPSLLNVANNRHNLNKCQHKWREIRPKLDRFKICFGRVLTGHLSHDDRMEIAKIEWRHDGNPEFKRVP
ncbi:hypothetical protein Hanom_Chr07g00595811 [Helianthus anomalus]